MKRPSLCWQPSSQLVQSPTNPGETPLTGRTGGERVDPTDVTEDQFYAYLDAANRTISQFDLEIRSSLPQDPQAQEDPPQRVWALVNNTSDPLTQLATTYTADEVAFIKRLLDYMFLTNNTVRTEGMCVAQLQAVGLHKAPTTRPATDEPSQTQSAASQSLTMTQAEKTIRNLIEEGWFQKSRKGYLTLTPRALMELRGWLAMEYNDEESTKIRFCAACKDMVTVVGKFALKSRSNLTTSRANVALTSTVRVASMTIAYATFSGCNRQKSVLCARRSGLGTTSSARGLLIQAQGRAAWFADRHPPRVAPPLNPRRGQLPVGWFSNKIWTRTANRK